MNKKIKLIDKFSEFTTQKSWEKENFSAKACVEIADNYALDFVDWLLNTPSRESKTCKLTDKECLFLYKKEKGLL